MANKNKILILGNGFDLRYGLKSSYMDFFNSSEIQTIRNAVKGTWIFEQNKWMFKYGYKRTYLPDKNFFLTFLLLSKDSGIDNWSDVEFQLHEFLDIFSSNRRSRTWEEVVTNFFFWKYSEWFHLDLKYDRHDELYAEFLRKLEKGKLHEEHPQMFDFLLNEVKAFEAMFADYLKNARNELEINPQIMHDMNVQFVKDSTSASIYKEISVLNFNYTDLIESSGLHNEDVIKVRNVHGSLENNNIIFGYDKKTEFNQMNPNVQQEIEMRFTKTARILNSSRETVRLEHILPGKDMDLKIQFFGHSLAEADYSYFQSIFDYYNIYENVGVTLEFCYSAYDETKDLAAEQTHLVYRLLSAYGNTLNNKDQGNNLLHKLVLENRIKIKLIQNFPKEAEE